MCRSYFKLQIPDYQAVYATSEKSLLLVLLMKMYIKKVRLKLHAYHQSLPRNYAELLHVSEALCLSGAQALRQSRYDPLRK